MCNEAVLSTVGERGLFSFLVHFYFSASGRAVFTGVAPSPPRFSPPLFIAYLVECPAISLLVGLSSSVANSRSRAFRKSIFAQEKVPTNLCEYAHGGAQTHETDL